MKPQKKESNKLDAVNSISKLPPQAVELEETVLGALLIMRDCYPHISCILKADDFYRDENKLIYSTISDLFNASRPIDILTVTQQLKFTGDLDKAGGGYYIAQLPNRVASSANAEYHAFVVKEKSIQRNLIKICTETIQKAYEDSTDVLKLVEQTCNEIDLIGISDVSMGSIDAKTRIDKTIEAIKTGRSHNGVTGVPCGIVKVDRFTGGFQKDDLIFIGARPGNYKTALIMAFAHKMLPLGFTPFIAQQEMGEVQSGMRELAIYSGVDTQNLRRGLITDEEMIRVEQAAREISTKNVFIDHTGGLSLSKIKAKVKKQTKIKKIDILFIDYLQLLELELGSKQATEESLIAKTTRKLKLMAKELKIPIVALSQLSREVEKRGDKRPVLSDLKGSGAIEADADMVILLFNASRYSDDPRDQNGNSLKDKVELIFCKNRQGDIGSILLNVNPATNTFNDDEYFESFSDKPVTKQNKSPF